MCFKIENLIYTCEFMLLFWKENKILRIPFLEKVICYKSEWWGRSLNWFLLNYESKDRKLKKYYNSWRKVKHLLVGSTLLWKSIELTHDFLKITWKERTVTE